MNAILRRERSIIFSGSSVRGILDDRKWATRRVVKGAAAKWLIDQSPEWVASKANELCPYGQVGDLLWVRENFWQAGAWSASYPEGDFDTWLGSKRIHFAADGEPPNEPNRHYPNGLRNGSFAAADPHRIWRSRPSIHMPRWASRILLEITDVRVERLQDITYEQARAEGYPADRERETGGSDMDVWLWFRSHWEEINGAGSYSANPMVWVVEFRRIQP
ncbi:hypothetical protein [Pseudomonas tohonis]|uniref:hypothetical protein n=1 Tax=Pseudomonas tohonis TaxID=2725477 RepID=UPI001F3431F2|nr:hypothetical protein [Pseudomonas tohonis]